MNDLEALFDNMDSFKEDLLDFGIAGLGAIAANVAWKYIEKKAAENITTVAENPMIGNVGAIIAGVAAGAALAKYNKNVATGVAVGLTTRGLIGLLKKYVPELPVDGLGYLSAGMTAQERAMLFSSSMSAAPSTVEEVNSFGAAPSTVEEVGFSGLAATLS